MAYDNGIVSIETVGGVTYGVSVYDVQRALGRGTTDVGQLCSDLEWYLDHIDPVTNEPVYLTRRVGKINKWAKYKPVRSGGLKVMTLSDMQDAYFGLDVPIYGTGPITISDFLEAFSTAYAYLPPRGADRNPKEWFRLRDFDGYNRAATPFTNEPGSTLPRKYRYGDSGGGANFMLSLNTGTGLNDGISASEWKIVGATDIAFSDMYFGLLFVHGNEVNIVTASTTLLSQHGTEIHIDDTNNDGLDGLNTSYTYTVYPILCTNSHTSMGSIGNLDILVPLPIAPFSFQQISVATQLVLTIDNETASLDYRNRPRIQADLGFLSSGTFSSIAIRCTLFRAAYDGDTEGSQLENTGTYEFTTVTESDPAHLDTGLLATMSDPPDWIRIHAWAPNQTGVQADFYVLMTREEDLIL